MKIEGENRMVRLKIQQKKEKLTRFVEVVVLVITLNAGDYWIVDDAS